jgi:hypothetical protein
MTALPRSVASLAAIPLTLAALVACDDTTFTQGGGGGGTTSAGGWCGVESLISNHCLSCHSAASKLGGLDLETDPYNTLLSGASQYPGRTFVVPGDPTNSFLMVKLQGTQAASEGGQMPVGAPLSQASLDLVSQWITDGATQDCTGGGTTTFTCDDANEQCSTPNQAGCPGEGPTMLPGADCLACHDVRLGDLTGPITAGGTAFTDLGGSAPLVGAKIHITDEAGGNEVVLNTNSVGNFYTVAPIPSPFVASLESGGSTIAMVEHQTDGGCNSCHNCSGAAGGKLHAP